MKAQYLRVKDWKRFQHYNDRHPPWIKLYQEVITDTESGFSKLSEPQQWQLVRIWLLVSCSDITDGRGVQIISYDETWIRRCIRSMKRVELEVFIHSGLLEVLASEEVDANRASEDASAVASTDASVPPPKRDDDARKPPLTSLEVSEKSSNEDFLFRVWVSAPGLIRHRESYLDRKVRAELSKAVGKYGRRDVAAAMGNYASVLASEAHYWTHRWTLADFLKRGLDKFVPEAEPLRNFRRELRPNAGLSPTEIATMFDNEEVSHVAAGVRALGRGD